MLFVSHGSWTSPVSVADLAKKSGGISHSYGLTTASGAAFWAQPDAAAGGAVNIFSKAASGETTPITTDRYVRSGINEYGGGAWTVASNAQGENVVIYSDWPSGDLRMIKHGNDELLATGMGNKLRYGSLSYDAHHDMVVGVREDHCGEDEPINSVFSLHPGADIQIIASGKDFYASPSIAADGRVAYICWDHPNMPWDKTQLYVDSELICEGDSILFPAWSQAGALFYLSDASGYWNLYRYDGQKSVALYPATYDFCAPMWVLDPAPYAVISEDKIGCSWLVDGYAKLGILHLHADRDAELIQIPTDAVSIAISGHGSDAVLRLGYANRPVELARLCWESGNFTVLASDSGAALPPEFVSTARPLRWKTPEGEAYAWYYPPRNPGFKSLPNELPPVQVLVHGGPTAFSAPEYRQSVQFLTTRGIGVLDVNYSGSSGYGREYRNRLQSQWGVIDVRDVIGAVTALCKRGLADPNRIAIRGGSAGGYTALQALTNSDVFSAGISLYGIGNLEAMAQDTHKFESRYLDQMIAPYPAQQQVWHDRSPIYHLDKLNAPMLLLQGEDDCIVPPSQAHEIATAIKKKGLRAELIVFPGEGHGFRKAETIVALETAALNFLGEVFGFPPML